MSETSLFVGTERDKWMGTSGIPWHAHVWQIICWRSFSKCTTGRICRSPVL